MANGRDEAIAKAIKLLKLSESSNPHEAALAAARAQEILDRYEIDRSVLEAEAAAPAEPDEPIMDFGGKAAWLDDPGTAHKERWRTLLASVVARANGCYVYNSGARIGLVGRPGDADKVRYLFAYAAHECDRLCDRDGRGCGRTWRNNYRLGIIDTLRAALRDGAARTAAAARADYAHNPCALVKVEQALERRAAQAQAVAQWVDKNMQMRTVHWNARAYDGAAREAGRKAGREIALNGARGALGSGNNGTGPVRR